jgi:HK97 family phage major capsid protein
LSEYLKKLVDDRQAAYHAAKTKMDEAAAESRSLSAEEREFVDRTFAELDEKRATIDTLIDAEKREREIAESMRGLEDVARPVELRNSVEADDDVIRSILRGERRAHTFEVRDLTKSSSNAPVPTTFSDQVVARARLVGPLLDPSIVTFLTTTSGEDFVLPSQAAWSTATIKAEAAQITESDPEFGKTTLRAHKFSALIDVGREFIEDSNVDILGFLSQQLGDAFGYDINSKLTLGTGTVEPQGLVTAAGTGVTGGTADATRSTGFFTGDEVIDLIYSLDGAARRMPSLAVMANGKAIAALRKLKDNDGAYLFTPTLDSATPDRVVGVSLVENPHMADPASGAKSLLVADMKSYYVRSAGGLQVSTSSDFKFDYDLVTIRATWRIDGNIPQTTHAKVFLGGTA